MFDIKKRSLPNVCVLQNVPAIISKANALSSICSRRNFNIPRVMYGFEVLRPCMTYVGIELSKSKTMVRN